jgi:hypothetical protein
MKELQSIYNDNIKLAKKLEELGLYQQADRVDNVNLIVSQKLVLAKSPLPDPMGDASRMINNAYEMPEFISGVEKAIEKVSKKKVNLTQFTSSPILSFLSKLFSWGILGVGLYNFFIDISNDQSNQFGDTPKEQAQIAANLADVVSGISYLASASTGNGPLAIVGGIAMLASFITKFLISLDIYTDETDIGKKSYPGGGRELVQDAYELAIDKSKSFDQNKMILTVQQIIKLKDKIGSIAKKEKIRTKDVLEAFAIIDSSSGANPLSKRDIAYTYNLVKKKDTPVLPWDKGSKKPGKEIPKDMKGFDVPFTP